jgi:pyruvate/2-oxoglutarate/acetoin dehydrogenase E1 component
VSSSDMKYKDELTRAMTYLGSDPKTLFLGQAVAFPGTAMTTTLTGVSDSQKVEFPVAEELQLGASTGLALGGFIPVTLYPRWNFLLLAVNQLIGHADKLKAMSQNGYAPKIIVRVGIGSERPLHPQCQHVGDFTEAFRLMLTTVEVIRLDEPEQIFPAYEKALTRTDGKSTIVVEWGDYYAEK